MARERGALDTARCHSTGKAAISSAAGGVFDATTTTAAASDTAANTAAAIARGARNDDAATSGKASCPSSGLCAISTAASDAPRDSATDTASDAAGCAATAPTITVPCAASEATTNDVGRDRVNYNAFGTGGDRVTFARDGGSFWANVGV